MGGDDHVGEGQQAGQYVVLQRQVGAVLEEQLGFFLVDIQAEVTQLAVLQGLDQRRRIDQCATAGIDQHRAGLQLRQALRVDQVAGVFGQGAVQADDLCLAQQLRQFQITRAQGQQLRVGVRIVRQQLASETGHDAGEGGTDLASTDHPDGFAMQVEAGQPVQAEVAFAGAVVGAVQATVEGQDQGDGVFRHSMRRIGRYTNHRQAQAFRCAKVDVVVAGRAQGDQARTAGGEAFEHGGIEVIVDERADHFMTAGQRCGVFVQARWLKVQLQAMARRLVVETVLIVGLAAEKQYAHEVFLSRLPESLTAGAVDHLASGQALRRAWAVRRMMARSSSSRARGASGSFCLSRVSLRWQAARSCGTPQ
ncbi:hypothetical protein D3C77_404390 [compost metagenome]